MIVLFVSFCTLTFSADRCMQITGSKVAVSSPLFIYPLSLVLVPSCVSAPILPFKRRHTPTHTYTLIKASSAPTHTLSVFLGKDGKDHFICKFFFYFFFVSLVVMFMVRNFVVSSNGPDDFDL